MGGFLCSEVCNVLSIIVVSRKLTFSAEWFMVILMS